MKYPEAGADLPVSPRRTKRRHEHYMFIESENSPKDDPVLLWTNG